MSISVVIIFLDAASYLEDAIESVRAQTLTDWELILVDDGATDGSEEIAARHASREPDRIRLVAHPGRANEGKSRSRNLGAEVSRGEFLLFLDADDVLLPEALASLRTPLVADPRLGMTYGPLWYWYEWARAPFRGKRDFIQSLGVPANTVIDPPTLFVKFLTRQAATPSGMLIRADVFQAVGAFEPAFRWMYEDQVLCAKICLAYPVRTIDTPVYRYRQHAESSSAVADAMGEYEYGRLTFLEWVSAYLERQNAVDRVVARALSGQLWWVRHPRIGRLRKAVRRARRRLARLPGLGAGLRR